MYQYLRYFRGIVLFCIISPILMTLDTICCLLQPYFVSKIIDVGVADANFNYIIMCGIIMIALITIGLLCAFGCRYFSVKASAGFARNLRQDLFKRVYSLPIDSINKLTIPSLLVRLTNDVNSVADALKNLLQVMVRALFLFVGGIIMVIVINFYLSWIIIVLMFVIAIVLTLIIKLALPHFKKIQTQIDMVNSIIKETIISNKLIRAFVIQDIENEKFKNANTQLKKRVIKSNCIIELINPLLSVLMNISIIAIVAFGAFLANNGQIEIGELSAYIMYIGLILISLILFSSIAVKISRANISVKRINEILNENIVQNAQSDINQIIQGKIDYDLVNLQLQKDNKKNILRNINLSIYPAERLYIVGSIGAGKTTLINMLLGFHNNYEGSIYIDNINIKEYSLNNLRKGISVVPQESILFSGTIIENLSIGMESATEQELIIACETAKIHKYISQLPNKYNSLITESGKNLSGGQRQRICIARALLKKPKILILDNCFSAIDMTNEKAIIDNIYSNYPNTTILIITSRVNVCSKKQDRIIVMDKGEIIDIGNSKELLSRCDIYKELYESQMEVYSHENN